MLDGDENDLFHALDDHTVLFAFDGSEQARASILEGAHRLGPDRCAIVLTVWPIPFAGAEEAATRIAYEGASLARSIGFDAQPVAANADPIWRGIVDCAAAHDASIVVLASGDGADGSIAAEVARHTECTVLILHAQPAA